MKNQPITLNTAHHGISVGDMTNYGIVTKVDGSIIFIAPVTRLYRLHRAIKAAAIYLNARLAGEPHAASRIIARGLSVDPWREIELAELSIFTFAAATIVASAYVISSRI